MKHRRRQSGDARRARTASTTEDAQLARTDVNEADLRRCNRCAEPFVTRRARRQDHGQDCSGGSGLSFVTTPIKSSWIYTCTTCQHLCTDCHAKEIGKAPVTRAMDRPRRHPQQHLYHLSPDEDESRTFAVPPLQVGRSPSAEDNPTDCKKTASQIATIRLQALDRAMQAAKVPHLILRVAPGCKQRERKEWATSGMIFGNGLHWRKQVIWNNF